MLRTPPPGMRAIPGPAVGWWRGAGAGRTLVCLPGIEGDARVFWRLAAELPGRRVEALDLSDDDSVDGLAAAVLSRLPAGPVHLFGVSLGGLVARRLAARHPDRVCSLVTLGSLPDARHRPPGIGLSAALLGRLPASSVQARYRRRIRARLVEEGVGPDDQALLLPGLPDARTHARRLAAVARWTPLAPPALPVLWLRGQAEREAPWQGRDVVAALPAARSETVPGGHRAHLTHPVALAAVVGHFIRGCEVPPGG